jgi:hypothetical protein
LGHFSRVILRVFFFFWKANGQAMAARDAGLAALDVRYNRVLPVVADSAREGR